MEKDRTTRFHATVQIRGVNPYVAVRSRNLRQLGSERRGPTPVLVWINELPPEGVHTNLMPMGDGGFYLYLHGGIRKASRTKVGDPVRVTLSLDRDYRGGPQHPIPNWFQSALDADATASKNWTALPPSRKKELIRYLVALRSGTARSRNTARAIQVLSGRPGRFLGRDWVDGR